MATESCIEIYMSEEEKEKLEQFAKALGWTLSELEVFLAREFIRKNGSKKVAICPSPLT